MAQEKGKALPWSFYFQGFRPISGQYVARRRDQADEEMAAAKAGG